MDLVFLRSASLPIAVTNAMSVGFDDSLAVCTRFTVRNVTLQCLWNTSVSAGCNREPSLVTYFRAPDASHEHREFYRGYSYDLGG